MWDHQVKTFGLSVQQEHVKTSRRCILDTLMLSDLQFCLLCSKTVTNQKPWLFLKSVTSYLHIMSNIHGWMGNKLNYKKEFNTEIDNLLIGSWQCGLMGLHLTVTKQHTFIYLCRCTDNSPLWIRVKFTVIFRRLQEVEMNGQSEAFSLINKVGCMSVDLFVVSDVSPLHSMNMSPNSVFNKCPLCPCFRNACNTRLTQRIRCV